jgi:hypothetical protein
MSSIKSDEILNAMKLGATLRFRSKNNQNATRRLLVYGQKERRMDGLTYHTFIADYQKLLNNRAWYEPGKVFIIEWSWRGTQ